MLRGPIPLNVYRYDDGDDDGYDDEEDDRYELTTSEKKETTLRSRENCCSL